MRKLWKGILHLKGVLNIPIGLYPIAEPHRKPKTHWRRASDLSPVGYKAVSKVTGEEVARSQIVNTIETPEGEVVLTPEDYSRVQREARRHSEPESESVFEDQEHLFVEVAAPLHVLNLKEFVHPEEISPAFIDKSYYVAPESNGSYGFVVLRDALKGAHRSGVGVIGLRGRERLASLQVSGDLMLLQVLHYADEMLDPSELAKFKIHVEKTNITKATTLVRSMSHKWKPGKYKDTYHEKLVSLIHEKIAKGNVIKKPTLQPTNVTDITHFLDVTLRQMKKKKHN